MKTEKIKLIAKVILIIVLFCLSNFNTCYALASKQDVEEYVRAVEEDFKEDLKRQKMKDGRIYFGCYTGSENKKYVSHSGSMSPYLEDNYYQMEDTIKDAFKEYFSKNLDESLPDEERLVDYIVTGGFPYTKKENYNDGNDIEAKIGAIVFPASEKTIWAKNCEKVNMQTYSKKNNGMIELEGYATESYYIHLKKQDGKYQITYLDIVPEGFSDFVERMKNHGIDLENLDYESLINSKPTTEIVTEIAEKENFENENIVIKSQMNIAIIVICSLGIVLIIFINLKSIRKFLKSKVNG